MFKKETLMEKRERWTKNALNKPRKIKSCLLCLKL